MSDKPITLEFLSRQQAQMLNEFADFRDQLTVLTLTLMRVEQALTALIIEVREVGK